MAHQGLEKRPAASYFTSTRPKPCSQGDVYSSVPFPLPFAAIDAPLTVVSRDVMVLTRSCDIDFGNGLINVAPLQVMAEAIPKADDATAIRRYDCFHGLMYLPDHGGHPERIVNLEAGQLIRLDVLTKCDVQ